MRPSAPAFPTMANGLTQRDYIAIAAMQGELASQAGEFFYEDYALLATKAYEIADAMLEAREKTS